VLQVLWIGTLELMRENMGGGESMISEMSIPMNEMSRARRKYKLRFWRTGL